MSQRPIRYISKRPRFSHSPELSPLYRQRKALLELDTRGSIDPAFVARHLRRVTRDIDVALEMLERARHAGVAPVYGDSRDG